MSIERYSTTRTVVVSAPTGRAYWIVKNIEVPNESVESEITL